MMTALVSGGKGSPVSTLGQEKAENPRLQRRESTAFVEQMRALNLEMPQHLTEALRTNRTGGKTVAQLLDEAASRISFMSMEEVRERILGTLHGLSDVSPEAATFFAEESWIHYEEHRLEVERFAKG